MHLRHAAAVALLAIVVAAPAAAQQRLDTLTVDNVGQVLTDLGVAYTSGQDQEGAPYIELDAQHTLGAEQVAVIFYACDPAGNCEDIRLWSWVAHQRPIDLAQINQWNAEGRWTKAYLDQDNDPVLEMDVNATGGIGTEALASLIGIYGEQVEEYVGFILGDAAND